MDLCCCLRIYFRASEQALLISNLQFFGVEEFTEFFQEAGFVLLLRFDEIVELLGEFLDCFALLLVLIR